MILNDYGRFFKKILPQLIVILALVGSSFYWGYYRGTQNPEQFIVSDVSNISNEEIEADFGVFWEVWKNIKTEYIRGAEVEAQKLIYGAVTGLVESLDDQNSVFLPPDDSQKFAEDIGGSFGGIGAEIGKRDKQLIIVAPLKDSPAERAGLLSGDAILKINDQSTAGIDVMEAVKLIRGPVGELVTLTIARDSWSGARDIVIEREVIKIPVLDLTIEDGIAHIKLHVFNESAPWQFYRAIADSASAGVNGIILDLRNNPGGFLEVAVNIAGWFLDRGAVIVSEEFSSGEKEIFRASGNSALKDVPTVILVNGGSASASEILAGALRDQKGIKLVGEKTFGKGTVQQLFGLRDGSSVKLTVAHWLLPNGQIIEKEGLVPDVEVELTENDMASGDDPQLDKAKEVLLGEIQRWLASN